MAAPIESEPIKPVSPAPGFGDPEADGYAREVASQIQPRPFDQQVPVTPYSFQENIRPSYGVQQTDKNYGRSTGCGGDAFVYDTPGVNRKPDREILPELELSRQRLEKSASNQNFDYDLPKGGGKSHIEAEYGKITSADISRPDGSHKRIEYTNGRPSRVSERSSDGTQTTIEYGMNGDREMTVNYPDGRSHKESRFGGTGHGDSWTNVIDTEANGDYVHHKIDPNGNQVSRTISKSIGESPEGRKVHSTRFTTKDSDTISISADGNTLTTIDLTKLPRPAVQPLYPAPQ